MESQLTDDYHITFFSFCPSNNHLCDDNARWWPLVYEYVMDKKNIPVHGSRILFGPICKPNDKKYILWIDSIRLTHSSCYICEPFNFNHRSRIIKSKHYIDISYREFLLITCSILGIFPPIISVFIDKNPLNIHLKIA